MNRWNISGGAVLALVLGSLASAQDAPEAPDTTAPTEEAPRVLSEEEQAAEFRKELQTVEEDVSNLKERVFRSKATLKLLKELVVDSGAGGSQLAVWHVNQLGKRYTMESAQYYLDGKTVFDKTDPNGSLDDAMDVEVYNRAIAAGDHDLQVNYVLRGSGGLFNYLRSYQFRVQSAHSFQAVEGERQMIRVQALARGGMRRFVDRPTVVYAGSSDTMTAE